MKLITKRERELLDQIAALKWQHREAPQPATRAEIRRLSAELHAEHARAEQALAAVVDGPAGAPTV
jgi:hypothetical protein